MRDDDVKSYADLAKVLSDKKYKGHYAIIASEDFARGTAIFLCDGGKIAEALQVINPENFLRYSGFDALVKEIKNRTTRWERFKLLFWD